jgi:AraC-like DNA-binding protein
VIGTTARRCWSTAATATAPARDWTVASLAAELALSRSSFAARFTELVGEPVMA